ncbi:Hypothetical protein PHPALM_12194 [Phytophthora palmivora]|uniref:Tf2-1-like SH3-like domain-containing protein n=1 Tax=Phytophthora palmivora TaxID=4796 RepID=A0A2P4Y0D2_9STRA|nr:Hypothetical protein PHPALM_12194 [Phytophthora palmivora]
MAESQDVQKEQADARGRRNVWHFEVGDLTKLRPRFIGPFKVVAKKGLAYTLNLPKKMHTHPVFYVGLLKPYRDPSQHRVESQRLLLSAAPLQAHQQVNLTLQTSDQVAQLKIRALRGLPAGSQVSQRPARPGLRPRRDDVQPAPGHPRSGRAGPPHSRGIRGAVRIHAPRRARGQTSHSENPAADRRPPALLDQHGELHYHLERLLKRRRRRPSIW